MSETRLRQSPPAWAWLLVAIGSIALIASFAWALSSFATLATGAETVLWLAVPPGAIGMAVATALIVSGAALLGRQGAASAHEGEPGDGAAGTSVLLAIAMLIFGVVGFTAAYALSADKVVTLLQPNAELGCNVSLLVQCGANLESWQGAVFGFPNPLIGLVGWSAVIVVAVDMLLGMRFRDWFWRVFALGVAGALTFVVWLISQSIFVLGTLCPWCMVTWAVTIPLFWVTVLGSARRGHFGSALARTLGALYAWTPLITIASYLAVAIIAQLRLDLLLYL